MSSFGATLGLCAYLGWGLATSPLPVVALGAMLLNKKPGRAAAVFTAGWFIFNLLALAIIAPIIDSAISAIDPAAHKHTIGIIGCALGTVLIVAAIVTWQRSRHSDHSNNANKTKAMIERAANADVRSAAWLAFIFSILNVTNYGYWAGIGLFLHRSGLPTDQRIEIALISAAVATSTFLAVTLLVLAFPERIKPWLAKGRHYVETHSGSMIPGILLTAGIVLALVGTKDLGLW